jgi:hypothetical protein
MNKPHILLWTVGTSFGGARCREVSAKPMLIQHNECMQADMQRHLAAFLAGVDPSRVVFDLTPGSRLISMTVENIARKQYGEGWLLYLRHTTPNGRVRPGAELPMLWRAGEEGPWPTSFLA